MINLLFLCLIVCGCLKIQLVHAQCSNPAQADTDRQMCSQIQTSTIMANGITCTRPLSSPYTYTATCDSPTFFDYCRLPSGTTQIQFMIQPNGNTAPGGLNSFSTCVTDSAHGFNSCVGMGQAVTWSSLPATPFSFIGKSTIVVRSPPAGTDSGCALAYNFVILGPNDPIPSSSADIPVSSSSTGINELSSSSSSFNFTESSSSIDISSTAMAESSSIDISSSIIESSSTAMNESSTGISSTFETSSTAMNESSTGMNESFTGISSTFESSSIDISSSMIESSSTAMNKSLSSSSLESSSIDISSSVIESSTGINATMHSSTGINGTSSTGTRNSTYTNTTSSIDERFDKTKTINSILKGNTVIIGASAGSYFIISILISMFGL